MTYIIHFVGERRVRMTYGQKLSLFLLLDSCIVLTSIFVSMFIISANFNVFTWPLMFGALIILICHHLFAFHFKLYKKLWEYASVGELLIIFKVVSYSILISLLLQMVFFQAAYLRLLFVTWLLHLFLIGGSRFIWRLYRDSILRKADNKVRTLIVGAGSAGIMVARQLIKRNEGNLLPVAFIDDDPQKQHFDILGIPVVGGVKSIGEAVARYRIENIIIAIPSLKKKELNHIVQECAKTNAKTKILPLLEDIITGKVSVTQFRDVQVEDLLGREPVTMDMQSISSYLTNKVVLVSGAGGSIGSEITRQVAQFHPKQIILLGHGENSIYSIEMELKESFKDENVEFITEIGDIKDEWKMMKIMSMYKPDVVYHAAAHKHVPLMELHPEEAVKNNIIGTRNIARAASLFHVKTFVMISTDKAVNPTSVMGASKRLAEMIIQDLNTKSETKFVAVRFGNVLGSRGSVIPLFKRQIEKGGPVTVTHPDMVRYFMTIPEASRLVIQAGALAKGGEIFVLDMGEPVKIVDLARNLIKLSGYTEEEIEIKFTGIRPGEKLYEELLQADEIFEEQAYPNIYIGKTAQLYMNEIEHLLENYLTYSKEMLRKTLLDIANNHRVEQSVMNM
jgi:FlaA1/EpsC-like NDP-sugar epimerase